MLKVINAFSITQLASYLYLITLDSRRASQKTFSQLFLWLSYQIIYSKCLKDQEFFRYYPKFNLLFYCKNLTHPLILKGLFHQDYQLHLLLPLKV